MFTLVFIKAISYLLAITQNTRFNDVSKAGTVVMRMRCFEINLGSRMLRPTEEKEPPGKGRSFLQLYKIALKEDYYA